MYSSLTLWWLFTVIIPNMEYRTTFFDQLKKPYDALRFLNFAFCVARSNKSPVTDDYQHQSLYNNRKMKHIIFPAPGCTNATRFATCMFQLIATPVMSHATASKLLKYSTQYEYDVQIN